MPRTKLAVDGPLTGVHTCVLVCGTRRGVGRASAAEAGNCDSGSAAGYFGDVASMMTDMARSGRVAASSIGGVGDGDLTGGGWSVTSRIGGPGSGHGGKAVAGADNCGSWPATDYFGDVTSMVTDLSYSGDAVASSFGGVIDGNLIGDGWLVTSWIGSLASGRGGKSAKTSVFVYSGLTTGRTGSVIASAGPKMTRARGS